MYPYGLMVILYLCISNDNVWITEFYHSFPIVEQAHKFTGSNVQSISASMAARTAGKTGKWHKMHWWPSILRIDDVGMMRTTAHIVCAR